MKLSMPVKFPLFALVLCPALVLAQAAYVPKFARGTVPALEMANPTDTAVLPDSPARVLDFKTCPKPPWPRASLRNEETGKTTLTFTIAPTGEVVREEIARSSGFPDLDHAALRGLRNCLFKPAGIDGKAVESTFQMQYVWTLE